jgi:sulfatase maturation enzyme AslB (radical SAM superfamily)
VLKTISNSFDLNIFINNIKIQGFTKQYLLKILKSVYKSNKNYKCELCDKEFSRNDTLTRHINNFCKENKVHISTSLDGPKDLHNKNRPRPGKNSYEKTIEGINLSRDFLGRDQVSALMTTTEISLERVEQIIDEYLDQKFNGIFLRHLSPYGFAIKTKSYMAYSTDRWLNFYKKGIEYIIELNRRGIDFREYYACTVLKKMLTSEDAGFVDLMSPAGIGIAAVVYNYDGTVHPSDESRMLAEMGDKTFCLGNVLEVLISAHDEYPDTYCLRPKFSFPNLLHEPRYLLELTHYAHHEPA